MIRPLEVSFVESFLSVSYARDYIEAQLTKDLFAEFSTCRFRFWAKTAYEFEVCGNPKFYRDIFELDLEKFKDKDTGWSENKFLPNPNVLSVSWLNSW